MGTFKPESVGVPLSFIKCKVINIDTGVAVGPNCQGELVVQGPQVCILITPLDSNFSDIKI